LKEISVDESYGGVRENINKTIAVAWHNGTEVFTVGHYVLSDLGLEDEAFLVPPIQVQLICSVPVRLFYSKSSTVLVPMKYTWASDVHQNINPYTFTRHPVSGLWAITYAPGHQLYMDEWYSDFLLEIVSDTLKYTFWLYYLSSKEAEYDGLVRLFGYTTVYNRWHPIIESISGLDYKFIADHKPDNKPPCGFVGEAFA